MDKLISLCFHIAILTLFAFFCIFFCVNYPEVKRAKYNPTICQCLSTTIFPRFCCELDCTCGNFKDLPKCKSLVSQSQSLSPIACSQNSKNSTLCPKSGSDAYCDNEYERCFCCKGCKHSSHQKCQMNCVTCYGVRLNVMYYVGQQQQNSTYTQNFKSLDDANNFLSASYKPNSIFRCYYNPSSVTEIILNRNFTGWKWALFAFPALIILVYLIVLTDLALYACIKDGAWRYPVISIIWIGIIIPLVILLQVWKYGLVPKTGSIVLIVFILFFVAFGSLPVMIMFLITSGFSSSQAIILSFVGLIIPLVIYIPIILYVPSSNIIMFPILSGQLALVILTIICKWKQVLILKHIMYL